MSSTSESSDAPLARIPAPISPAEGANVDEPSVTFQWEQVSDATNYEIQLARGRDFENIIFEGRVGSSNKFTYSGLPPQEGIELHWRVRAKVGEEWTDFGPIGTFVIVDWRPEQPSLQQASGSSQTPAAGAASSSAEPILVTSTTVITVVALALAIIYMQGLDTDTSDDEAAATTTEEEEVSLDEYVVNREDGEFRIPIDSAMKRVVQQRGGTWDGFADTTYTRP